MSESIRKPVSLALGAALIGGLGLAAPAFAMDDLAQGYQGSPQETQEAAKTGEGRCGGDAHDKAAEGACGADAKKAAEGRCGGHADAAEAEDAASEDEEEKTHAEGKCGEGKCGGAA